MKLILESNATVKNKVKEGKTVKILEGRALEPTVSGNGNIYSAEEILQAQNVGVLLQADWEHTEELVGTVVYSLDESIPALDYRIEITDETRASQIKEGIHKVSIEADVREAISSCTRNRCYNLVSGITLEGIGITDNPGVKQTTLRIVEKYQDWKAIKEKSCEHCKITENDRIEKLEKQVAELIQDKETCKTCGKHKSSS